jgi:hypothetical protein
LEKLELSDVLPELGVALFDVINVALLSDFYDIIAPIMGSNFFLLSLMIFLTLVAMFETV